MVDAKFSGFWGGWCSNKPLGTYDVDLWKIIRRGWGKFPSHTRFGMENGAKVSFQHDLWSTDMAFKAAFPDLYGIACEKDASIVEHLEFSGGSTYQNISLARPTHDWEVDIFASFFRVLYSVRVRQEDEDKLWWVPSKKVCLLLDPSTVY